MFLPASSDYKFSIPTTIDGGAVWVAGNREKTLFAVLSPGSLFIYQANPQILLCTFKRDDDEIEERGEFSKCLWRHDSAAICILTNKQSVYIYGVDISEDSEPFNIDDRTVYDSNDAKLAQAYMLRHRHPNVSIYLSVLAKINSIATCVASLKDDLFVCLDDGWIHRITWAGDVRQELSFNIRNVPLSNDQVNAKYTRIGDNKVHVVDIVYCPLIGGLCVVLSDGRAALLVSENYKFELTSIVGIWTLGLVDAVCCAANHKFRLLYFGCSNGDVAAYHMDDTNGAMIQTFRVKLAIKDGTEYLSRLGKVRQIQCLPQGLVFAVTWESLDFVEQNGMEKPDSATSSSSSPTLVQSKLCLPPIISFFSPFGAQWWCSLEDASDRLCVENHPYLSVEWGSEGFQLWTANMDGLGMINLSRSISVNQPSLECFDRVALVSADSIYLSPSRNKEKLATAPHCVWSIYSPPQEYISVNFPLRFAAFDENCEKSLIVAGTRGFAHLQIKSGKWRLFRNENQEQNLLITGGVAVFQDYLIAVGADITKQEEGIYAYPVSKQIDQNTACKFIIPNRAMLINLRNDHMLTFDVGSVVTIYVLRQALKKGTTDDFECLIDRCAEIRIHELLPHPTCVISMQLTSLNYHSEAAAFCHGMDSLLVNVSGHLLLLSPFNKDQSESDDELFQLHQPMLIASNVERVWIHSGNREVPHLNKSLWINAGAKSMKIWLPLFHTDAYEAGNRTNNTRSFISKRIMLPVELNLYPISIDQDCLAGGIESVPYTSISDGSTPLLIHNVTRNSEVFVHRLLRQLLKRNLGVYALEIATSCRTLPYFSHILELLLHDVLDEEATSSEPIPDPLLPRVVAFIHEFPEYLETIVHCARKTELAFWNLLFSVSHHPRELFKMCLKEDQLDTAVSCLIILQSMESIIASVQHATTLLEESLNKRKWIIARDIVRFLKSIDGADLDETPESPLYQKLAPKQNKKSTVALPNSADDYNLVFNSISVETRSQKHKASLSQQSSGHSPNLPNALNLNGIQNVPPHPISSPTSSSADYSFLSSFNAINLASGLTSGIQGKISIPNCLNLILEKHADVLIEDFAIRDLGAFSSHLDFDLEKFFKKKEGAFYCAADEFPLALMKLHSQFKWPYPVVGDVIDNLIQRISAGDFTPSASEDEQPSSPGKVRRRRSSSKPSFDWKVFEKLCSRSSSKSSSEKGEPELKFMVNWLMKSEALEWMYLLSLLNRDLSSLHSILETNQIDKKRVSKFLKRVMEGTKILLNWARENCPAYVSILKLCSSYLEHTHEQNRIRRYSSNVSNRSSDSSASIILNGNAKVNGVAKLP